MVPLHELVRYTDRLLDTVAFQDYAPNGLQVEGRAEVRTLVSGVSGSQALIDAAIDAGADAILVHHGYFWRGEDPCIIGMKRRRLQRLLAADISLLAYHLPLDAHTEYGNNAQFARLLELQSQGRFGPSPGMAWHGILTMPMSPADFGRLIEQRLGRVPLHITGGSARIQRVGWCTGAAQGYIHEAAALGLDAYVSGEISESTVHVARELGIHYFAAGHHATERYGVAALASHLAEKFGLRHEFMDIENPV